ncbi:putative peptidoglycan binding protein [Murinocardiopsis flavida]|uniref:Putative peptidoglycan binding protein n=1 Tax=Murinocardiopsis flavida TaxID=645275 RepID=A0A2P8DQ67_9ACTN|nr:peptidoglycan-binding protein [Murinocardiopsis flavida]PSK99363.1 putative peptidoglycan binding protein [Murinocardiopsis flavida]
MFAKSRIAIGTAIAGAALAIGGFAAPAAMADGPDTPQSVKTAIQEQQWLELKEGDLGYRVEAVGNFLKEDGYLKGEPEADFTEELTGAVNAYQDDRAIPNTGTVNDDTWDQLSADIGLVQSGDARSDVVTGLQGSLDDLGHEVSVDGQYGPGTVKAIKAFQQEKGIDVDGIVGPLTFRAMYAEGAES